MSTNRLLGLLAALALASTLGVPVVAEEVRTAPLPPLSRSDLELLPLNEAERARFMRDHADLVTRVEIVLGRADRVDQNLAERENPAKPDDAGTTALREERARLAASAETMLPEIEARLAKAGVAAGALDRVRRAARGPLRADRYAHALVLQVTDPTATQRALFERLVPVVDGAVLALDAEVRALREAKGADAEARRAVADDLDQRRIAVERRFWRVVDAAFTVEQRAKVGRWLPTALTKKDDAISHVYLLPGLTPSQGVQFKALLLEIEAEASADTAEAKRAGDVLADKAVAGEARRKAEQALQAAQMRLMDLQQRFYEQGKAMLTPEQWTELVALPPYLRAADRQELVEKILPGLRLDAAQRGALAVLGARFLGVKRELEDGYRDIQRRYGETGPDAPEREMAEMMGASLGGRVVAVLREAYGEFFTRILTPNQVETWVLGLTGSGR
jgi:hypothetical protein